MAKTVKKKAARKAAPAKTTKPRKTTKPGKATLAATASVEAAIAEAGGAVLDRLWQVVASRRSASPALSHSARLLSRGTAKVAQKFGEEAVECLIEAVAGNHAALIGESADVLYHLMVLWVSADLTPAEVWAELIRREGMSGIAEKAARGTARPAARTRKIP